MASDDIEKFDQFLSENLQLKNSELDFVSKKLTRYFEAIPNSLLNDFFLLAQEVNLTPIAQQNCAEVGKNDARIAAPETHQLVFENEFLRILESRVKPEIIVPFHTHQWDSIILTLQGSKFRIDDGKDIEIEDWLPMAEKSEGSDHAYSYQNIGDTEFRALLFELKK